MHLIPLSSFIYGIGGTEPWNGGTEPWNGGTEPWNGYLHIDLLYAPKINVRSVYIYIAIDRVAKIAFVMLGKNKRKETSANFLKSALAFYPYKKMSSAAAIAATIPPMRSQLIGGGGTT